LRGNQSRSDGGRSDDDVGSKPCHDNSTWRAASKSMIQVYYFPPKLL